MRHKLVGTAFTLTLILSVLGFAAMARTGYTGGQVRHTELHRGAFVQGETAGQEPGAESRKSGENDEEDD
jgi:hypothetical protein